MLTQFLASIFPFFEKTLTTLAASSPTADSACRVPAPMWWVPYILGCLAKSGMKSAFFAPGSLSWTSAAYQNYLSSYSFFMMSFDSTRSPLAVLTRTAPGFIIESSLVFTILNVDLVLGTCMVMKSEFLNSVWTESTIVAPVLFKS